MATHIKGLEALDPKGNPKVHSKKHAPAEDKDAFKALLDQKKAHLSNKDTKAKKDEKEAKNKNLPHIAPNSPLAQLMDKKLSPKQEKELKKELKAQAKEGAKLQHSKNKLDPFSQAMALKGAKNAKNTPQTANLSDIKNLESAKALNLSKLQHEGKGGKLDKALAKGAEPKNAPLKGAGLAKGAQAPQGAGLAKGAQGATQTPQAPAKMSTADLLALKNPKTPHPRRRAQRGQRHHQTPHTNTQEPPPPKLGLPKPTLK
ncbi:hypothetical protein NHP190003_11800 [Helicobacter sp. NHP19-003]|uniref:Uncharacterized protein n=1 Tax=Helicobacter gastrocanis TaxID=2849641 RepID=A0ABN6I2S2_9HELI|nr:hypothetical protein [Helicobacter sp. NHP19-003]BCZ17898.1 hypothetical protein NHP190003_11800 [Helicobacter sp. NHP19-003]